MRTVLLIALGGSVGAVLRFAIGEAMQRVAGDSFPYGTLVANLLGCFCIGILYQLLQSAALAAVWRPLLVTGLLGALTTFSTFSLDSVLLVERSAIAGLANIGVSLALGLAAVYLGMQLGRMA